MKKTLTLSVLFLSLLTACTVGPNYQRPFLEIPKEYHPITGQAQDASQWLQARWWMQYKSPALNRLVSSALSNNRSLQQAMANVEKAASSLTVTRSDLFPQLNYSSETLKNRASENTLQGAELKGKTNSSYEILGASSWELDLWGKIRRQTESAQANLRSAQASYRGAIASVIGSTVITYLNLLQVDEQIRIAKETAQSYKETYDLFNKRFQYGNLSKMEVMQAKSQWQSAKVQVSPLEQNRVELLNSLSILTGISVDQMPKRESLSHLKFPVVVQGIPSQLLVDQPNIVVAEEQLIAANANIGVARAAYFPSISLSAGYGFSSDELRSLFKSPSHLWNFSGSITGPIFHWGAVEATVRLAKAEEQALLASYQLAVSQAFADVDNALSARAYLLQELKDKTELVESLKIYKHLAYEQYNGGYTGYVTVLQAEQSLLPQELNLAQVNADLLASIARIYQALGGSWIEQALIEEFQGNQ